MARFILHHMVRFGGDRMIPLGGVRGRTDRQTDTQTHRGVTSFNNIDKYSFNDKGARDRTRRAPRTIQSGQSKFN